MNPNSQSHPLLVGGRRLRRGVVRNPVVERIPHDPSVSRYALLTQNMHLTGWVARATSPSCFQDAPSGGNATSQGRTKSTTCLLFKKPLNKIKSKQILFLEASA